MFPCRLHTTRVPGLWYNILDSYSSMWHSHSVIVIAVFFLWTGRSPFQPYMPSKIWGPVMQNPAVHEICKRTHGNCQVRHQRRTRGFVLCLKWQSDWEDTMSRDIFFCSYELVQQLLKRKMTMVGTVCKNKPELPPALLHLCGPIFNILDCKM